MNLERTGIEKVEIYGTTMPLLDAMYLEFKELSKKKPDSAVSKNKIRIVNRLIEQLRKVLSEEKSISFLDVLEEDDIPQVSDVVLMLSQYCAAMEAFHNKYHDAEGYMSGWASE